MSTSSTAAALNESFALPGILAFDESGPFVRAQVSLPTCSASVFLYGAHLTAWQPAGFDPVLFLSPASDLSPGKPIRGGIPVCFPWFGPRSDGQPGPSHGFARIQDWELGNAALLPARGEGDDPLLHLTFTLGPTPLSRSLGFDGFRVAYEMIFGKDSGRTLTLRFSVANLGDDPLHFEEALHTYFSVADVHSVQLIGLESAPYLDKTEGYARKIAPAGPLTLTGPTDRVFPGHTQTVTIRDHNRTITNQKSASQTTVVWNPWAELSAPLHDLPDDAWPHFLCVETANTGGDAVTLSPRQMNSMEASITVTALP